MKRVTRDQAKIYSFDRNVEPILRVKQGESFILETEDNMSGYLRTNDRLPIPEHVPLLNHEPVKANPVAGPIYVEGAEKGDLLVVNIEEIIPDAQGTTCIIPGLGPLSDSIKYPELSKPHTEIIQHLPGPSGTTSDGKGVFAGKVTWDLQPFIGTIGVAPELEIVASVMAQGPFGGNIDVRDLKKGSKFYINCYNEGALLFAGDVHASQGDTEIYAVADECRAEITLSCNVVKNKKIPFLRIEKPESIVSLFCYRPLEVAVERSIVDLVDWMGEYAIHYKNAYIMIGICPDFRINVYQMCQAGLLNYTAGAEIPKKYLV